MKKNYEMNGQFLLFKKELYFMLPQCVFELLICLIITEYMFR